MTMTVTMAMTKNKTQNQSFSAFCHIAFQERKLGFIKMFNDKPRS